MLNTTTLTVLGGRVIDRLYWRSSWVRRCLRRTRYAIEYADLGLCCTGWYFEHTDDCVAPDLPRGCSDCCAPSGTRHGFSCSWYWTAPDDQVYFDADEWPDAARWPGHPIDDQGEDHADTGQAAA